MDIAPYIIFFCSLWQYCYLYEDPEECNTALFGDYMKPINVSASISEIDLDLSWDCDFPPEIQNELEYNIYLKLADEYEFKLLTGECNAKLTLETQSAVCLKVIPEINNKKCLHLSSEKCITPERNGTSAEEVSCSVFNTSSMTCTWMLGKNAPHGTTYILSLRQGNTFIQCENYMRNFQTSSEACTVHDLEVDFFDYVTVVLEGANPGIQAYKTQLKPAWIEIINPPRDVSLTFFGDKITLHWQSPRKQYRAEERCYIYIIENNQKIYDTTGDQYTMTHLEKECSVRIRAKGAERCSLNTNWGEWSEWVYCGPRAMIASKESQFQVELIAVLLVSGLILVLLIITTLQYKRILNTCFPRIPQPKNYLESTEDCKINTENKDCFSPILSKFEAEEWIVVKENF